MANLLIIISIMFIIAGPLIVVAKIIGLPTAPALIVAGLITGYFVQESVMLEIARLGIALLVFTYTVRIQTKDINTKVSNPELVAVAQMVILGLIGFILGLVIGYPPGQAIFIGLTVSMSSSIMGSVLFVTRYMDHVHDWLSEKIHSIQDFIGLFLLMIISAGSFELNNIAQHLGYGVIMLVFAVFINRYFFDLIGKFARMSSEAMLIVTIAILLSFLGGSQLMGTSIVVGAFAAGVAINHDPVKYSEVINGLESIDDFFAAIFFITVGALVSMPTLKVIMLTAILTLLAMIVKPAIMIWLLRMKHYERRTATLTGFNIDQIGEFALIFVIEGLILGILMPEIFEAVILAAAITLITSCFTRRYNEQIFERLVSLGLLGSHGKALKKWSKLPDTLENHIVIVGYGQYARKLVQVCEEHKKNYIVIESNPGKIKEMNKNCTAFVFGDVREPDVREAANISKACLIVSTADFQPINEQIVKYANQTKVILRTKTHQQASDYLNRGAFYVAVSDLLAADQLQKMFQSLLYGGNNFEELRKQSINMINQINAIS